MLLHLVGSVRQSPRSTRSLVHTATISVAGLAFKLSTFSKNSERLVMATAISSMVSRWLDILACSLCEELDCETGEGLVLFCEKLAIL